MKSTSRMLLAALVAALVVGTLDFIVVRVYWNSAGISFTRIGQSVARGWLGDAAFAGGLGTAMLGTATHYAIMFAFMLVYALAAQRLQSMRRKPVPCAVLYGLLTCMVMDFVVVPLSRAAHPIRFDAWLLTSIGVHVFLVGFGAMVAERWARHR